MTRQNLLAIFLMVLLFVIAQTSLAHATGMAKLIIKVVDEGGHPLEGARVSLYFQSGGLEKDRTVGLTDEEGVFSASGFSSNGITGGGVNKDRYYQSVIHHDFYRKKVGFWQPWGKELTVVMRPIVNPVPMYVRNTSFKFPVFGQEIGFDLEKADWVIPHGLGVKSDFIFKPMQKYQNAANFEGAMILTFSNPLDGIQVIKDDGGGDFNVGSWYRWPRTAPESGYVQKLERHIAWGASGQQTNMDDSNNYIFRVRSEVDENGKLKRAMYGKIRGELRYFISTALIGKVGMHYYLNPTTPVISNSTRNATCSYRCRAMKT